MATLIETVEALLWEDESTTLDFKATQYPLADATPEQKSEIIKDILAFANAHRRHEAYIILGANDNKGGRAMITGVTHHLDDADLQQLVNSKTNRTVDFSYHALTLDDKPVGVLRIPQQTRPTYLRKGFGKLQANTVYVRHGSSTSTATPDEIVRMGNEVDHSHEITALQQVHEQARFYERILRLWQDITRIPHHFITNIARPVAYEQERRALHVQFNHEYERFREAMNTARDLLTQERDHADIVVQATITAILDGVRSLEQTVSTLVQSSNSRLDTELPTYQQEEAAHAANTLSTMVAQRLIALHRQIA